VIFKWPLDRVAEALNKEYHEGSAVRDEETLVAKLKKVERRGLVHEEDWILSEDMTILNAVVVEGVKDMT
jgi:hypothetical protein